MILPCNSGEQRPGGARDQGWI